MADRGGRYDFDRKVAVIGIILAAGSLLVAVISAPFIDRWLNPEKPSLPAIVIPPAGAGGAGSSTPEGGIRRDTADPKWLIDELGQARTASHEPMAEDAAAAATRDEK